MTPPSESDGRISSPDFAEVVENVRTGKPEGLDQLWQVFRILSGSLRRTMGFQDFEDQIHDLFILVAEAIRAGKLRNPGGLPSYIFGVAHLSLCSSISARTRRMRLTENLRHWLRGQKLPDDDADERLIQAERREWMVHALSEMAERDREILTRFYLEEQTAEQIQTEMHLTETQFRLWKCRAKAKLTRQTSELPKAA